MLKYKHKVLEVLNNIKVEVYYFCSASLMSLNVTVKEWSLQIGFSKNLIHLPVVRQTEKAPTQTLTLVEVCAKNGSIWNLRLHRLNTQAFYTSILLSLFADYHVNQSQSWYLL